MLRKFVKHRFKAKEVIFCCFVSYCLGVFNMLLSLSVGGIDGLVVETMETSGISIWQNVSSHNTTREITFPDNNCH